ADRQAEPNLVRPGEVHQAGEIFHVFRGAADGKTQRASLRRRDPQRTPTLGRCRLTTFERNRQSEFDFVRPVADGPTNPPNWRQGCPCLQAWGGIAALPLDGPNRSRSNVGMNLTVQTQLLPDAEQAERLKATVERFHEAANWL